MKKVFMSFCIIFLVYSFNAFASGKISFKPYYNTKTDQFSMIGGFSIYEKLYFSKLAYNSWSGYGEISRYNKDNLWFISKHSIDIMVSDRFTVSPGVQVNYYTENKIIDESVFVTFTMQLW